MESIDYIKLLDQVLGVLEYRTPERPIPQGMIFTLENHFGMVSNRDQLAIMNKLVTDGYAKPMANMNFYPDYYITLEGILFLRQNGYTGEIHSKRRKRYKDNITNVLLTLAAVIGAVYSLTEIYKFIYE